MKLNNPIEIIWKSFTLVFFAVSTFQFYYIKQKDTNESDKKRKYKFALNCRNGVIGRCLQQLPWVLLRYSLFPICRNPGMIEAMIILFAASNTHFLSVSMGCSGWSYCSPFICHSYCCSWRSISSSLHF